MDKKAQIHLACEDMQTAISEARWFLQRLAKHLDENEMPGQSGNCTIKAQELTNALHRLDALRKLVE